MNLDKITQRYLEFFPGDLSGNPMQRQTPNFLFALTEIYGFKKAQLLHFNETLADEEVKEDSTKPQLSEEELKEVYEHGLITKDDFENAYDTANKIISTWFGRCRLKTCCMWAGRPGASCLL